MIVKKKKMIYLNVQKLELNCPEKTKQKTLIPIEIQKPMDNTKNATKNVDYITIADRRSAVSWSNNSHRTGVDNWVYGYQTIPLTEYLGCPESS